MKDKVVLFSLVLALLSVIIGAIGHFGARTFIFSNLSWHYFAQTCLLFGICWSVGKKLNS